MIIWKGWGLLGALYIILSVALTAGLIGSMAPPQAIPFLLGLGLLLGGAATAVHGWFLNVRGPKRRFAEWEAQERPRLEAAADTGRITLDHVQPRSREEAQQMVETIIERGRAQFARGGSHHTLFFIPMEIIGLLAMGGSVVALIAGILGLL